MCHFNIVIKSKVDLTCVKIVVGGTGNKLPETHRIPQIISVANDSLFRKLN